mmetsp:Transcript_8871/g.29176  ORF Transcript_8871/g.29176 Transcript_8871/m.29176 type:complete len:222 (-) Transcript_8871:1012-1677(-)
MSSLAFSTSPCSRDRSPLSSDTCSSSSPRSCASVSSFTSPDKSCPSSSRMRCSNVNFAFSISDCTALFSTCKSIRARAISKRSSSDFIRAVCSCSFSWSSASSASCILFKRCSKASFSSASSAFSSTSWTIRRSSSWTRAICMARSAGSFPSAGRALIWSLSCARCSCKCCSRIRCRSWSWRCRSCSTHGKFWTRRMSATCCSVCAVSSKLPALMHASAVV